MPHLEFISGEAHSGELDAHAECVECYAAPMQRVKLPSNMQQILLYTCSSAIDMPAGLEIQHLLVATVVPSQASTLVKELAQVAPLPGLQHLKRVQRLSTANSSAKLLEIILHALPEGPATCQEVQAWAQQELEAIGVPPALTETITRHSLELRFAQVVCGVAPPGLPHGFNPMCPVLNSSEALLALRGSS